MTDAKFAARVADAAAALAYKFGGSMAGVPDTEIVALLTAPDGAAHGYAWTQVHAGEARAELMQTGEWIKLKSAIKDQSKPDQVREAADLMLDVLTLQPYINLANDAYRSVATQALGVLVAAGVLAQSTVDALLALGRRPLSWAEANGVNVDAQSVGQARRGG